MTYNNDPVDYCDEGNQNPNSGAPISTVKQIVPPHSFSDVAHNLDLTTGVQEETRQLGCCERACWSVMWCLMSPCAFVMAILGALCFICAAPFMPCC